jgi:hypothetical protein
MERNRHRLTLVRKSTACTTDLKDAIARSANALRPSPSPRKAAGSVTVIQEHRLRWLLRPRWPPAKSSMTCAVTPSSSEHLKRSRGMPAWPRRAARTRDLHQWRRRAILGPPRASTSRWPPLGPILRRRCLVVQGFSSSRRRRRRRLSGAPRDVSCLQH